MRGGSTGTKERRGVKVEAVRTEEERVADGAVGAAGPVGPVMTVEAG